MESCCSGICVFGASSNLIDESYFKEAYKVGCLIGAAGDRGLMGAAARGCESEGGGIIGVIPEKLNRPGIYFEGCSKIIVTSTMHERKAEMERLSAGFIALAGGYGTIEEFMEVLTLKQLNYFDKPLVLLNTNGFYNDLTAQLAACVERGFTSQRHAELYCVCSTPQEAVEYCLKYGGMEIEDKLASPEK